MGVGSEPLHRVVELRHNLLRDYDVAALHVNALDAARDLERDDVLIVLDEPLVSRRNGRCPLTRDQK